MASIKVRLDRLETRFGTASFDDMIRAMTTEDLETLARLYGCLNTGQADEAAIAEIERIEARYRWGAPG